MEYMPLITNQSKQTCCLYGAIGVQWGYKLKYRRNMNSWKFYDLVDPITNKVRVQGL